MLNILRWYAIYENVHCFYSYYRPVGVRVFGVEAAPAVISWCNITVLSTESAPLLEDED